MIDIHCHLLPEIDDGPRSMGEALKLALLASQNGITHSVVTPHIHPGRYDNYFELIFSRYEDFKDALECHNIELELGMAAEVRISSEIIEMIDKDEIPFLGEYEGRKVMLLEFPHNMIPASSAKLVRAFINRGILPMIAHPERNKDVMSNLRKLNPFVDLGCLFQVTASSVSGYFGDKAKKRADQILKNNWCTVLASDAHNATHRPPDLNAGFQAATKVIGESRAWDLVHTTPFSIVESQFELALNDYT